MDPTVKALITIVDRGKGEGISAFLNRKYNQASFLAMGPPGIVDKAASTPGSRRTASVRANRPAASSKNSVDRPV